MGQVLLAHDLLRPEKPVAIKVLLPEFRHLISDFMREYSTHRRLNHPAIPRVHDFGFGVHAGAEVPYFVMDYVRGLPLSDALMRPYEWEDWRRWILDLLRALDHVHRAKIVHRDLKPSNILVSFDAQTEVGATLIDFGIAVPLSAVPEALFLGTPEYAAPDLMLGAPFDPRQDLYAVGLLMYELMTGHRPWPGADPTELYQLRMHHPFVRLNPERFPAPLIALVERLLAPAIEDRPGSAAEVLESLGAWIKDEGVPPEFVAIERPMGFQRSLETVLFPEPENLDGLVEAWLQEGPGPHPPVLLLEDRVGFDGEVLLEEISDRAAVAGARVVRYRLEARNHAPLEALAPPLDLLKRLREMEGDTGLPMTGLAGAATLLTRSDKPLVLMVAGLHWADRLSLQLILSLLEGGRHPEFRLIATFDPEVETPNRGLISQLAGEGTGARVERGAKGREAIRQWLDRATEPGLIPDEHLERLARLSEGRPRRLRELLAIEMESGALYRKGRHYAWDEAGRRGEVSEARPVPQAQQSAERRALSPLRLICLSTPVPEAVAVPFLGVSVETLHGLLVEGVLERGPQGGVFFRTDGGPSDGETFQSYQAELAALVERAEPFEGQGIRAAESWILAQQPLRAVSHFIESARQGIASKRGDALHRAEGWLGEAERLLGEGEASGAHGEGEILGHRLDLLRERLHLARVLGDRPRWRASAEAIIEMTRGLPDKSLQAEAQEGLMVLAADEGAQGELLQRARELAFISHAGAWATAWANAKVEEGMGQIGAALKRLQDAAGCTKVELRLEDLYKLNTLELEIMVRHGWLQTSEEALARHLALGERLGLVEAEIRVKVLRASLALEFGRIDEALDTLRRLGTLVGDGRYYRLDAWLSIELGRVHLFLGWWDTAREHLAQGTLWAMMDNDSDVMVAAQISEIRVWIGKGRLDMAREVLALAQEGIGVVSRMGRRHLDLAALLVNHADADYPRLKLLEQGRALVAGAIGDESRRLALASIQLTALCALEGGALDEALHWAREGIAQAESWGFPASRVYELWALLARIRSERREHLRARWAARRARQLFEERKGMIEDKALREQWLSQPRQQRLQAALAGGTLSRFLGF